MEQFRMCQSKPVSTHLGHHTTLSITQALSTKEERSIKNSIRYANGVGSVMYGMVRSRPDLARVVSIIIRFIENPSFEGFKVGIEVFEWLSKRWFELHDNQGGDTIVGYMDDD